MRAGHRISVVIALHNEGAGMLFLVIALDGDGKVGSAAHDCVVDADAVVVGAVEGDADAEGCEERVAVDGDVFFVRVHGAGVLR